MFFFLFFYFFSKESPIHTTAVTTPTHLTSTDKGIVSNREVRYSDLFPNGTGLTNIAASRPAQKPDSTHQRPPSPLPKLVRILYIYTYMYYTYMYLYFVYMF